MMYWSVVPIEVAYAGYDDPSQQPKLTIIRHAGVTMEVESVGPAQVRIHRLISPHASDFMKPEWMPGQVITL